MAEIVIEDLKSIKSLRFQIPVGGVHILTSINGSGKTTLLACLERLANSYAFQRHFKTSSNNRFDNFQSAKITYSHNNQSVSYKYRNTNWAPTPRQNASTLRNMGFNQVIFITSSVERFYVQSADLQTNNIISAAQGLKDAMNEIFQTTRFTELRRVKVGGKGRGDSRFNYGFLLPAGVQDGHTTYFTEKNFSLGQILMLNALSDLQSIGENSLILIDEVELALHSRVQIKFLQYLQKIAVEKNSTVIISTHSSSLIKAAPSLIYLQRITNGNVEVIYNCYPAIALQNIAVTEEVQPDIVFFVEDENGKLLLNELLSYYFQHLFNERGKPIIKILPVGGYPETIRFSEASAQYLIPANTRIFCFLDLDVRDIFQDLEAKVNKTPKEHTMHTLFTRNSQVIKYLPITPELGVVEYLRQNPNEHVDSLQQHFDSVFGIDQIIADENNRGYQYPDNPREVAKIRLYYYLDRLKAATNLDETRIRIKLYQYFAEYYGAANSGPLRGLFNPIFNRR